ncbi:MAG TPA: cytochrome c family protein [Xanthobacteraceae bacterium]|jgi:cytochrome c|nr:cytochrome c family protein [Xanthobacteraceae bacterium]
MDSFELNKILGALLATCMITLALNITASALFAPRIPAKPGYEIAVLEHKDTAKPQAPAPVVPIETLLASAQVDRGEQSAKKCAACHTFAKGGPNRVGPNLWGVVGRSKASEAGFNYSAALKGKGANWSFEDLNKFLADPKAFVPGTAMTFAGLTRDSERADVIAYLNTLADNPAPLPKAAQKK